MEEQHSQTERAKAWFLGYQVYLETQAFMERVKGLDEFSQMLKQMRDLIKETDTEAAHTEADAILCRALVALGFEELVNEFEKLTK